MPMRDVRNERLGEFIADGLYLNNGGNGYPGDGWVRLYFGNGNPTPIMMNGTDIAIDGTVSANQLVGGLDNLANVIPPASTDEVGAIGTSGSIARGDHQHPLQAIGDAGTYNQVTTDAFGRVVSGSSVAYLTGNQTVTLSGDASGSGATAITVTLATVNGDVGTFGSASSVPVITTDAKGRITAAGTATITPAAIGALPLTGGTLTGSLTLAGDPAGPLQAATQQYVDNIAQGLDVKASVLAATTANITLSGAQTIDGVSVTTGARVLVKNQAAPAENGIYDAATGAWSRAADMNAWTEIPGAFVFVEQGTVNGDTGWVCTANQGGTLGTTAIPWTQFAGVGTYTGSGLITVTGTTVGTSMATARLIGRTTAGTGATEEISVGTGLTLSGGSLAASISASAAQPLGGTASAGSTGTVADAGHVHQRQLESIIVAAGDETTAITTGAAKVTFRMPYAFTLTAVRASLTTAQASGSIFTVDINENGTSVLSTKLTIDNGETTSVTAATPPVISDTALADDSVITVDVDQIGNGTAAGLKVTLIGRQSA